jgi:hypothetical protein
MINYKEIDISDNTSSYYFYNNYIFINKKKGINKNNLIINIDLSKIVNNPIFLKINLNLIQRNKSIKESLYIFINDNEIKTKQSNNKLEINKINYENKKIKIEINNIFKNPNSYNFSYEIFNANYLNTFQESSKDLIKIDKKLMINKNVIGDNNIIINENFDIIENTLNYKYNFEVINKNNKFPNLKSKLSNGTKIKSSKIIPNLINPIINSTKEIINNMEYNYIKYDFNNNNLDFEPFLEIDLGSIVNLRKIFLNDKWVPENSIFMINKDNNEMLIENNILMPFYYLKKINKKTTNIIIRTNKLENIKIVTNMYPLNLIENTQVLTSIGYKKIKDLTENDLLLNSNLKKIKISSIEKNTYANSIYTNPYILKKGLISKIFPSSDIIISPNINFKYKNKWIIPRLIKTLKQEENITDLNYYKINLLNTKSSSENIIINNGIIIKI